jgi:hypothetical protein
LDFPFFSALKKIETAMPTRHHFNHYDTKRPNVRRNGVSIEAVLHAPIKRYHFRLTEVDHFDGQVVVKAKCYPFGYRKRGCVDCGCAQGHAPDPPAMMIVSVGPPWY